VSLIVKGSNPPDLIGRLQISWQISRSPDLYLNLPILRMKRKNVTFSKRILVKFPCNFSKMKKNCSQFAYGKNGCRIDKKAVFRQEGCFVRQSFVIIRMKGGNLQLLYSRFLAFTRPPDFWRCEVGTSGLYIKRILLRTRKHAFMTSTYKYNHSHRL
jgi:hypothetical protein